MVVTKEIYEATGPDWLLPSPLNDGDEVDIGVYKNTGINLDTRRDSYGLI